MKKHSPGFHITHGKGFHITFANGYTVSVQFGGANYCQNYESSLDLESLRKTGADGSADAETAVWGPDGTMLDYKKDGDTVQGYMSPADVLELLNWAAAQ